ncbi:uncharacterized protein MCYG_03935 [Microsporum canis CBS 113480]|uniref:Uncharacterized protein n=1 Tax=Arthroderma otae (strain ATCC MYA-4605 / CBS 113480) TaxID=554155 RepID=C5FML3_ARTOC|nr:uncharacterized protein MCYG_03935 [Microsporum canis CBS 113480]EEQ31116.1 predicted protein [Microsporum canis CBS 113480]
MALGAGAMSGRHKSHQRPVQSWGTAGECTVVPCKTMRAPPPIIIYLSLKAEYAAQPEQKDKVCSRAVADCVLHPSSASRGQLKRFIPNAGSVPASLAAHTSRKGSFTLIFIHAFTPLISLTAQFPANE